jgi:hypothetical protein
METERRKGLLFSEEKRSKKDFIRLGSDWMIGWSGVKKWIASRRSQ